MDEELNFSAILAQRELAEGAAPQIKAMRRDQGRRAHLEPSPINGTTPDSEKLAALPAPDGGADTPLQHPGFDIEEWYGFRAPCRSGPYRSGHLRSGMVSCRRAGDFDCKPGGEYGERLQAMPFCEILPEARIMMARRDQHHSRLCLVDS